MNDIVLNFFNEMGVGTAVAILVVGGGFIFNAYQSYKSFMKKHDEKQVSEYTHEQEYEELCGDVKKLTESFNNFITEQRNNNESVDERINKIQEIVTNHLNAVNNDHDTLSNLIKKMNLMIESDKEDIKSFIVVEYYRAMEKGYIEPYIMETIETRYDMYLRENGNTYIKGLMDDLRKLPKH